MSSPTEQERNENCCATSANGYKQQDAEEVEIPMPWGHISGKRWGPKDVEPVICLHGWQDNSGTFDNLAPLLAENLAVLAVDLPGHGFSSHLPAGLFYYVFWDGLLLLRRIVKHYKLQKLSVLDFFGSFKSKIYDGGTCFNLYRFGATDYMQILVSAPTRKFVSDSFSSKIYKGHGSGKWWGPRGVQPIVALHGRQDNAGTFDNLIPTLSNQVSFLCLDLPGHGFSSHLPKGQFYYVHWDGVQYLRRIAKHFKWTKVKLMGHSLGGAIGFLYAATYPDEVDFLISLDIASPSVKNVDHTAATTGVLIDRFLKYEKLTLENVPCYEYEEMIDVVEDAYHGAITRESAKVLMKRGMTPATTPGRYYFARDPRLKSSILGMLSLDLVMAYASRITCAYLNIRAVPGLKFDEPANYQRVIDEIKKNARKFEYHEVPGTHHVHLNEPEKVAPIITAFLSS